MNRLNVCVIFLLAILSMTVFAAEKVFLTVDKLVDSGYILLSGERIKEIMSNRTITVVDIETDAVTISEKSKSKMAMDRKFVEKKNDKTASLFDPRLMARAPALEGKVKRKVVGDELISSDGIRTYHYRLYEKNNRIFAVRDIDHGNVFFEVKVK